MRFSEGGGSRVTDEGVSLNAEILKCSDGVRTMLPLPDIQRGGNDAAGNTADIENAHPEPPPLLDDPPCLFGK